ncbi:putative FBD-associated F-box protein At5g56440 [Setaria viridis]|uniref:putative FBD-associated F-box protein At5g56440 n=1 Tax=Setaria viridis TaxID=4556 RepID=UPI0014933B73|nr:putative FBD-associated F-box protein At5g56440 [Setaria viridis]
MTKKSSTPGGADRLGALPDELLHHVMSFLPAHDVVSTSLLAWRWHDLWKSAPALRVTSAKSCNNPLWFIRFVDNLLLLRDPGAQLDSFVIDLEECDFYFKPFLPAYERSVNLWFRLALLSQARVLSLRTSHGIYMYKEESSPFELPDVPIISKHLITNCILHVSLYGAALSIFQAVQRLIGMVSSPRLVSLVLSDCGGRTPLLENMPFLVSAVVRLTAAQVEKQQQEMEARVERMVRQRMEAER